MVTNKVTATVSTRGRFHTTFPLVLTSLANQTLRPEKLIIYDDNDQLEDLRENEIYKNLFFLLNQKGINWSVVGGNRRGQVHNHQRALTEVETEYIWRLDDDNIMEPNVLQEMFEYISTRTDVAAVGPLVLDPKAKLSHPLSSNKIEDIFLGLNIQWCDTGLQEYVEVDHLQGSTFLFRKSAAGKGYNMTLSRVGHREETIFTYNMRLAGYKLVVLTGIRTWHMRYGSGGIRSESNNSLYESDERIFRDYLLEHKVYASKVKFFPLNSGIGDHYAFRLALPDLKKRFPDHRFIVGACYPAVFEDEKGLEVISLAEIGLFVNVDKFNLYSWMDHNNWSGTLAGAIKEMYSK